MFNKLTVGGFRFGFATASSVKPSLCHSGARSGAQVASLRSLVFRPSVFIVEPNILAESDKSQGFGDGVPEFNVIFSLFVFAVPVIVFIRAIDR